MTRALLLCVVLLLAGCAAQGCAAQAPIAEPTVLEPLAAAPASSGGDAVGTVAVYALLGLGALAVFLVDVLLLPAYLASDEKGLWFPCCRFLF